MSDSQREKVGVLREHGNRYSVILMLKTTEKQNRAKARETE